MPSLPRSQALRSPTPVSQVSHTTHVCLVSHNGEIGKQCRPLSDNTPSDQGLYKLFAFKTEISIKHGNNKNQPDTPSIEKGLHISEELK